jgi:stage III sporulation protein AF
VTAWLSDWLRDIIAVILLAALVELLLPNKSMQRYARLVVGLFILITILTPILKLFQSDMKSKLDSGLAMWSTQAAVSQVQMASLSDIRQSAEQLNRKREQEVAKLTELKLEQTMQAELEESAGIAVEQVDAELRWVIRPEGNTPYINKVTVTLKQADSDEKKEVAGDGAAVEEVMSIDIAVRIDGGAGEMNAEDNWVPAPPREAALISGTLVQGWGIKQTQIVVRQQKPT